ncbi:FMN-binding negative transcriptional regulator [Litorisediminicola beolgyonensis]|uniref:FMN-binding negative transcriptional regulator n=1 Tax=Litorisediminicola beolgyonensis TaxID=1173614 RepID=A0ABW3ZNW8_9RHOB
MHPNPSFRGTDHAASLAFVRNRGFGVLAVSSDAGAPMLSHVPFLLSEDGAAADLHLVRSNPICRTLGEGRAATLAVLGPDGYVSPDWYGVEDQVPTWNYVAVHLTGRLLPRPADEIDALLVRQSADFEARLAPKRPWTMDKMTEETRARFLRMILPVRLEIASLESTWKLNQNKPDAVRHAATERVEDGFGQELAALAALMRTPPSATGG